MDLSLIHSARPARFHRGLVLLVLSLPVAAGIIFCLRATQYFPWSRQSPVKSFVNPDNTKAPPGIEFKNTRAEVQYVGDEACASCHSSEAKSYRRHPMGRSLVPIADIISHERFEKETHNPFEQFGFQFQVNRRNEEVFHQQVLHDNQGKELVHREDQIHFALGSGSQGRAYLIERNGYLYESAISWYSQKQIWDLSPGFDEEHLGGRPISANCLFCHSNRVRPVKGSQNRFQKPIFRGYSIGCERCHGPGQLHVGKQEQAEVDAGPDDTIVNPARLPLPLREAVCQQCHLIGASRILPPDRQPFDYRPGLPLQEYWAIFVRPPAFTSNYQAVGQVEQMYASRCFRASNRHLGCISCHDPHSLPPPDEKVAYFRQRCLQCHERQSCTTPKSDRQGTSPTDNCIQCHMPRFDTSDIAHTAATDHRIRRRPAKSLLEPKALAPGEMPIVNFYREFLNSTDATVSRNLGVGLINFAQKNNEFSRHASRLALPFLDESLQMMPQDVPALEARARANWFLDRRKEARADLDSALALEPKSETILQMAGTLASAVGDFEAARNFWQRAQVVNPWEPSLHFNLARQFAHHQNWPHAIEECQAALRLDPADSDSHRLMVLCWIRTGELDKARRELEIALALKPDQADALHKWFEQLTNETTRKAN